MPNPPIVVLLSGWAGTGKDAAASLLAEEMSFHRLAFADALKQDVSDATGLPVEMFHNRVLKDRPIVGDKTPRDLLLSHAAAARAADPDIYARKIAKAILAGHHERIVISDWRYKRELEFLQKELNDRVLFVRGRIERRYIVPSTDPSEHDLDDMLFDFIVDNDYGLSGLRDEIKAAVRQVMYIAATGPA